MKRGRAPYLARLKEKALALANAVVDAPKIEEATRERARVVAALSSAGRGRPAVGRPAVWKSAAVRFRDRAKKLAARITDRPGRDPHLVSLALDVLRALALRQGPSDKLSIDEQWRLVEFIDGRIAAGLTLNQAAGAAIEHVEYPEDPSATVQLAARLAAGEEPRAAKTNVRRLRATTLLGPSRGGKGPAAQPFGDRIDVDAALRIYRRVRGSRGK